MDIEKTKSALQDLIIRLKDAEDGYIEIYNATGHVELKSWLDKYSKERHQMHENLESQVRQLGGDPEVKTSFLGSLHRVFIDFKINNFKDDFSAIVEEIDRGSERLLNDYDQVLNDVDLTQNVKSILENQKAIIEREVEDLKIMKEKFDKADA
mgnify:CR=1 FL=1